MAKYYLVIYFDDCEKFTYFDNYTKIFRSERKASTYAQKLNEKFGYKVNEDGGYYDILEVSEGD